MKAHRIRTGLFLILAAAGIPALSLAGALDAPEKPVPPAKSGFATREPAAGSGTLDRSTEKPHPAGFADIPWGASMEEAKAAILTKPGVASKDSGDGNVLTFVGGSFVGAAVDHWELHFMEGRFWKGVVLLKPVDLKRAYADLKKEINRKYRLQGREEYGGGIHYATYWNYASRDGAWEIACDVNTGGVRLMYRQIPGAGGTISRDARKEL